WTRVDRIPPLAEPAGLPAGAGTAIFNLLARLAVEQDVAVLRYDAPYPTEALFLALLESFRYVPEQAPDPSGAFAVGALAWTPAPHEVTVEAGSVWVQQRQRIEKIVLGGRTYYRPDWQGVRRRAPRVVRDVGDTVRASLSVLGRVLEDHVVLAADGRVLETPPAAPDSPNVTPLAPEVIAGLIATVVATSAPALAPWRNRRRRPMRTPSQRPRTRSRAKPRARDRRRAPIHSGRAERWAVRGARSRPPFFAARDRGAPRFTRGAPNAGGVGGPVRGP